LQSLRKRSRHAFGRFACPVCQRRVAAFDALPAYYSDQWKTHGYVPVAENDETCNAAEYSCPSCGASDRDRLYALWLKSKLPRRNPSFTLIDFAPAPALSAHIRRRFAIRYRTADLFMPGVDDRVDLRNMPLYPTASIDAFICSHVLEHIPEDTRAMAELFRILKPGGWGIVMVPIPIGMEQMREDFTVTSEAERWRHFGQGDHVRIYSRAAFVSRLEAVGFAVTLVSPEEIGTPPIARYGLSATSVLYIASKRDGVTR